MSADSPRRNARGIPAIVPPQVVSDRSIIDSVAGFINDVTLNNQPQCDPKDTITWARFETAADISDTRFCDDWELEGNVAPPLLLILGYGQGVQVWAIPANGEAVEVLSWRHGIVSALRVLPTPLYAENGRADEPIDAYAEKRPLMALCDGTTPAGSNPQFCAVNFVSLKTGAQVKTIKFKNPVLDILANRSSIVITFHERIAVFDARSLEDRLSVTTCFPSPGINPNPVALGTRWMAYSENKLLHSKRSGGGCDGDGVASYTATVLNAAKSFGKGLRELGEQVAAGLTGTTGSGGSSKSSSFDSATGDVRQGGVVTILDIKHPIKDVSPTSGTPVSINGSDPIVAHFIAHSEAVVAMEFDNSGMMLLTADRRGHDFHLFRIQPHPVGSSLAAVHHIYVLHRGDTSAKVQNITFSLDSRWVAVSTLRGTTHVFPVTPYGGPAGVRTHTSLHVVNKLSRFHRSAGLTADGRSSSPISHSDSTNFSQILMPYHNPTMPPFPRPTIVLPLAQLRQPFALGSPPGSAAPTSYGKSPNTRQRLSSLSDDNGKPLSVCAVFAKSRSWLLDPPNAAREAPHKIQRKAVDSLFVMAGHGALIQYDLDTKLATNVAKEKICDDTPIELEVEAKAQWNLGRKDGSPEIMPPLAIENWLLKDKNSCALSDSSRTYDDSEDRTDSWLSQVEIITHAGPHRRLWMGPQFVFKTYNTPSGSNLSHIDVEAVEIGVSSGGGGGAGGTTGRPERSSPLNMPLTAAGRSAVPVLIESGSYSSIEQSPKLMDRFRHEHMNSDFSVAHGDNRLKEDLADAMRESPSVSHKDSGGHPQRRRLSGAGTNRATTSSSTPSSSPKRRTCVSVSGGVSSAASSTSSSSSSAVTLVGGCGGGDGASELTSKYEYESLDSLLQQQQQQQQNMKTMSIEKVVNPLGTVTTITGSCDSDLDTDDVLKNISAQSYVIHENCDESLFRPVVAIFCDENINLDSERFDEDSEFTKPPETIGNKLIVPVIEKAVDLELTKKESLKNRGRRQQPQLIQQVKEESDDEVVKFNIADVKRKQKIDKKKPLKVDEHQEEKSKPVAIKSVEDKVQNTILPEPSKTNKADKSTAEELPVGSRKSDEFEVIPSADRDSKPKPSKSRKSVEKEILSEEISTKKKSPDNETMTKSSKTRKSQERDLVSDEVDCIKKSPSDKVVLGKSKAPKGRKSAEKEILGDDKFLVVEKTSMAIEISSDKAPKNVLSERDESIADVTIKPRTYKSRKSLEKEVVSSLEEAPPSDKIVEKSIVCDELKTFESHFENNEKSKTSCKTRKSIDRDGKSPEGSSKESSRKSSVVEISLMEEPTTASTKRTKKDRKSEEKESTPVRKSSVESSIQLDDDQLKKASKDRRLSEEKKPIESRKTSLEQEEKLTKTDKPIEEVKENTSIKPLKLSKAKKSLEDEVTSSSLVVTTPLKPEDLEDEKPVEFKRMTTTKVAIKPSKPDKPSQIKSNKPRAKSPEESKVNTVSEVKEVTSGNSKKKNRSEVIKAKVDTTAEMPLAVELSNASDLADSLLDFNPNKTDDSKSAVLDIDKLKKKTDDVIPTVKDKSPTPPPMDTKDKESKKSSKKSKADKSPTSPSGTITPPDNLSEACDTIITVEEKETEPLLNISVIEKKSDKKTPKEVTKSDNSEKSVGGTLTAKQAIEPAGENISATSTASSSTGGLKTKTMDSPKKSKNSPLKFVDSYDDNFIAPEIPSKKTKKKPISVKTERSLDKSEPSVPKSSDGIQFFDAFLHDDNVETPTPWKPIVKVEEKPKLLGSDFPTLGKPIKTKKSQSPPIEKPEELPPFTTVDIRDEKKNKKTSKSFTKILDDLPLLEPLDDFLPPLATLESVDAGDENISLINFESPLQETSKPIKPVEVDKIPSSPQYPKGFPAENIIFALCGSLHYENENTGKPIDSPLTLSFSDSTAHTTAEYKSLTENDDQYLSLEQSSQENNPSTSSSTCEDVTEAAYSSGGGGGNVSGETAGSLVIGKPKNKQRRKKQLITAAQDDDEELRPLISKNDDINLMTNSSIMTATTTTTKNKPSDDSDLMTSVHKNIPLPTTSSDDNNQVNSDSSSSDQAVTSEDTDGQLNISNKKTMPAGKIQVLQHHHSTEGGGTQSIDNIDGGDLSSSSLSTGSRASLDPPSSSPTMSITGDNLMHFPADSSGSL